MKVRIIAWTDRGEIDIVREWEDITTGSFGFGNVIETVGVKDLPDALSVVSAQVAGAYEGCAS